MTCIIGIKENGLVYMGGDSAGVGGLSIETRADEKVFKKGEMVMGFTSSFRMGQLLRFNLVLPYHKPGMDTYEYMVTEFVEAVRECLRNGGFSRNNNGEESGGTFLVGYKGRLFAIQNDFQVAESANSYTACGCGEDIALGSLYSSADLGIGAEDRISLALGAAEEHSAGVRGPFVYVNTTEDRHEKQKTL